MKNIKDCCKSLIDFNTLQVIPDYFAATVLQRSSSEYPQVFSSSSSPHLETNSKFWCIEMSNFQPAFGNLKFQVAFNLVVIWMIVFICLSKGHKIQISNIWWWWWCCWQWLWWYWQCLRLAFLRQGCLCFWDPPHHWLRRICLQDSSPLSPGGSLWLACYLHKHKFVCFVFISFLSRSHSSLGSTIRTGPSSSTTKM